MQSNWEVYLTKSVSLLETAEQESTDRGAFLAELSFAYARLGELTYQIEREIGPGTQDS